MVDFLTVILTALVIVVPAFVKVLRPSFLTNRKPKIVPQERTAAVASL